MGEQELEEELKQVRERRIEPTVYAWLGFMLAYLTWGYFFVFND